MKKAIINIVLSFVIILISGSVYAMESISDNDLANVTGQASTVINVDEGISMNVKMEGLSLWKYEIGDGAISLDMTGYYLDGTDIYISPTLKPMIIELNQENNDTVISVTLPVTEISIKNIPEFSISTYDSDLNHVSTLGKIDIGNTTVKINSGKISARML